MKFFSLSEGEGVVIGDNITVTVSDIDGDEVTLAIDVPEWLEVEERDSVQDLEVLC